MRTFSSGDTVGVGALIVPPPCDRELRRVAGEAALDDDRVGPGVGSSISRARSSMRDDQVDVDGFGLEGPGARLRRRAPPPTS